MSKRVLLAIFISYGLIFTANAQITNAFGQLGVFYNTNDHQFALREHILWIQGAVGLSLGAHFDLGIKMNQFLRYGRKPYFDYLWEGGPFVRGKWNLKEYHHFYAELGVNRGNICPCGGIGSEYIIQVNDTYHLSFTNGLSLKIRPKTYFYAEYYWNFILEQETADFGFINAYIGIRHYLRSAS